MEIVPESRLLTNVHVHDVFDVFPGVELADGLDEPGLIGLGDVGLGVVEDVRVAVGVVVGVLELHVAGAHAAEPHERTDDAGDAQQQRKADFAIVGLIAVSHVVLPC